MSNESIMWLVIVVLIGFWAVTFYVLFSKKQNPLLNIGPQPASS